MTLKASQRIWVIDENLAWDNLIYLAVGRMEYLSQLIQVKVPSLSPKITQEIEETKKKRWLEHELRPSIQEKLIRYIMDQDKKKGHEVDLIVNYILMLNIFKKTNMHYISLKLKLFFKTLKLIQN